METFIYVIRPMRLAMLIEGATPAEEQALDQHYERLKQGVESGFVRLAGRTTSVDETTFGIVIFDAKDMEAASAYARSDPAVVAGVLSVECHPFRISLP